MYLFICESPCNVQVQIKNKKQVWASLRALALPRPDSVILNVDCPFLQTMKTTHLKRNNTGEEEPILFHFIFIFIFFFRYVGDSASIECIFTGLTWRMKDWVCWLSALFRHNCMRQNTWTNMAPA